MDSTRSLIARLYLLQMNLIPRAREDVRPQVEEWFRNDLKDVARTA